MKNFIDIATKLSKPEKKKFKKVNEKIITEVITDPIEFIRDKGYVIKNETPTTKGISIEFYKKTDATDANKILQKNFKKTIITYDGMREIEVQD